MRNDFENECKVQYIEFNNVFMSEIPNYYTRATTSANKEKLIFYCWKLQGEIRQFLVASLTTEVLLVLLMATLARTKIQYL